jgi:hypothetical protein
MKRRLVALVLAGTPAFASRDGRDACAAGRPKVRPLIDVRKGLGDGTDPI